jgi:hypothetical protein
MCLVPTLLLLLLQKLLRGIRRVHLLLLGVVLMLMHRRHRLRVALRYHMSTLLVLGCVRRGLRQALCRLLVKVLRHPVVSGGWVRLKLLRLDTLQP